MWRIAVSWYDEKKTIIQWDFDPNWTWFDVYHAIEIENELIDSVDTVVDTIVDTSKMDKTPTSAFEMVKKAMRSRHSKLGITVLFGDNIHMRMMFQTIVAVHPEVLEDKQWHLTATEAEASVIIKQYQQDRAEI